MWRMPVCVLCVCLFSWCLGGISWRFIWLVLRKGADKLPPNNQSTQPECTETALFKPLHLIRVISLLVTTCWVICVWNTDRDWPWFALLIGPMIPAISFGLSFLAVVITERLLMLIVILAVSTFVGNAWELCREDDDSFLKWFWHSLLELKNLSIREILLGSVDYNDLTSN